MPYEPAEAAIRVTDSQRDRLKAITKDYGKRALHEGLEELLKLAEKRISDRHKRKLKTFQEAPQ